MMSKTFIKRLSFYLFRPLVYYSYFKSDPSPLEIISRIEFRWKNSRYCSSGSRGGSLRNCVESIDYNRSTIGGAIGIDKENPGRRIIVRIHKRLISSLRHLLNGLFF